MLDRLLSLGYRYASVSNSDNLGAAPNAVIAGWFATTGAPYAAEICRRTAADRKGGHLAIRKSDRRLILRDRRGDRRRKWTISPMSSGIRSSTPTTCGSILRHLPVPCGNGSQCSGCR